ncbi:hypothetical protein CSC67_07600 [Pusillimonas caeni]|uniref:hypothetical protein n=1 Tax=Pusillimonas caeni TaxID=1348472 RepID=UPI000E59C774|nr:hypothetical protein [Pusillimonas caeni]TFL14027.1 hypothetical protein CSC67_07600 [Pusillimonas caeni]
MLQDQLWWLDCAVLYGKDLALAIERAIEIKIDKGKIKSRTDVAHEFGVSPQAIRGWVRTGSIGKERLPKLWEYFSDVVGPEHWGFSPEVITFLAKTLPSEVSSLSSNSWPFRITRFEDVLRLNQEQINQLDLIMSAYLLGVQSNARKSDDPDTQVA